jgi:transposase
MDVRERVLALTAQGLPPTDIARRLLICRQTVYRYQRNSAAQGGGVPTAKPAGGYRWSIMKRDTLVAMARLALAHPKWTVQQIKEHAVQQGILSDPAPSDATLYRSLHKTGLTYGRVQFVDAKTTRDPLIALERRLFRESQQRDSAFASHSLLFSCGYSFIEGTTQEDSAKRAALSPSSNVRNLCCVLLVLAPFADPRRSHSPADPSPSTQDLGRAQDKMASAKPAALSSSSR